MIAFHDVVRPHEGDTIRHQGPEEALGMAKRGVVLRAPELGIPEQRGISESQVQNLLHRDHGVPDADSIPVGSAFQLGLA